jgi:thymidylate synthase ThyX
MYECKVLADSISQYEFRITSFQITFPRIILAEFNTHRVLSRNSASSRAIPVEKRIRMIELDPFAPVAFGKNQSGMQATEELGEHDAREAAAWWERSTWDAIKNARHLADAGVHKQLANRVIEPFAWHTVIVTGTEWQNFENLRDSKMAQPEIKTIAVMMKEARRASDPTLLADDRWHLPMVGSEDFDLEVTGHDPAKVSAGRCARVSYLTHDGERAPAKDVELCDTLISNGHMSPLEHPCRPMTRDELSLFQHHEQKWNGAAKKWERTGRVRHFLGNVEGWIQFRKMVPGEEVYEGA